MNFQDFIDHLKRAEQITQTKLNHHKEPDKFLAINLVEAKRVLAKSKVINIKWLPQNLGKLLTDEPSCLGYNVINSHTKQRQVKCFVFNKGEITA